MRISLMLGFSSCVSLYLLHFFWMILLHPDRTSRSHAPYMWVICVMSDAQFKPFNVHLSACNAAEDDHQCSQNGLLNMGGSQSLHVFLQCPHVSKSHSPPTTLCVYPCRLLIWGPLANALWPNFCLLLRRNYKAHNITGWFGGDYSSWALF